MSARSALTLTRLPSPSPSPQVWVANVGDSRAAAAPPPLGRRVAEDGVYSRHLECEQVMAVQKAGKLKAVALSEDQKPDTPAEQKRIEKAGGFVSPPEEERTLRRPRRERVPRLGRGAACRGFCRSGEGQRECGWTRT